MMFKDRAQAGKLLAQVLMAYRDRPHTLVIGLPRGGVVVAYEVAKELHLPLDVICPRKIGAPHNPELAIGAITETGEGLFNEHLIAMLGVSRSYIQETIEKEKKRAQERLNLYRQHQPPIIFEGKTVILVDDGLATGSTMKAAIRSVETQKAEAIVVAIPVSSPDTYDEIREMVDEIVCLSTPLNFEAVGQFYEYFGQTEDDEVIAILKKSLLKH